MPRYVLLMLVAAVCLGLLAAIVSCLMTRLDRVIKGLRKK